MPAGDLIAQDWQLEIGGLLTGAGTDFHVDPSGISGIGNPQVKAGNTPLDHADGSFAGRYYRTDRVISVPYVIALDTPSLAGAAFVALNDAWSGINPRSEQLHLQLPGFGHMYVVGQPGPMAENTSRLKRGIITCLATFVCPDPTITYVP